MNYPFCAQAKNDIASWTCIYSNRCPIQPGWEKYCNKVRGWRISNMGCIYPKSVSRLKREFRNIDLRTDNLKLRSLVDKELGEMSEYNTSAPIMYSPEYDGFNVYAISGDYTVKDNEVIVSVILKKKVEQTLKQRLR